jgi:hypothetical protein
VKDWRGEFGGRTFGILIIQQLIFRPIVIWYFVVIVDRSFEINERITLSPMLARTLNVTRYLRQV